MVLDCYHHQDDRRSLCLSFCFVLSCSLTSTIVIINTTIKCHANLRRTVILSSRNVKKLQAVADKCRSAASRTTTTPASHPQTRVSIVPWDASNESSTAGIVPKALQAAGDKSKIDVLILNAGIFQSKPAVNTTKAERDRLFRVNYQAPVDVSAAIMDHWQTQWQQSSSSKKQQQQAGHIVVVTSITAHGPHGLSSTYAATKAALRNYFQSVATENASWLRIDVACPAATDTAMFEKVGVRGVAAFLTPARVAQLIVAGAAGPAWMFYETWMAQFPALTWLWLRHFTPDLFYAFCHLLAYVRVNIWEHHHNNVNAMGGGEEGEAPRIDAMDVPMLLDTLVKLWRGRYPE